MPERDGFRRRLGLVLSGGGALGAWQAGALYELQRAGLEFDALLGFSAGSLNAAAYALGLLDQVRERWADGRRVLVFSPRLWPLSLFSDEPLRRAIDYARDDEQARGRARCRLVVASARVSRDAQVYGVFDPKGLWDGPLAAHLLASCAIPLVFPRVTLPFRGRPETLFDGGVGCATPFSFRALGDCADVIVLEMVRPDEVAGPPRPWLGAIDGRGRRAVRRLIDQGAAEAAARGARVFRLAPSRVLDFSMLDFNARRLAESAALGESDARAFLAAPAAFATPAPGR